MRNFLKAVVSATIVACCTAFFFSCNLNAETIDKEIHSLMNYPNLSIIQNEPYSLPQTVECVLSDGEIAKIPVFWSGVPDVQYVGAQYFTGRLIPPPNITNSYDLTPEIFIKVLMPMAKMELVNAPRRIVYGLNENFDYGGILTKSIIKEGTNDYMDMSFFAPTDFWGFDSEASGIKHVELFKGSLKATTASGSGFDVFVADEYVGGDFNGTFVGFVQGTTTESALKIDRSSDLIDSLPDVVPIMYTNSQNPGKDYIGMATVVYDSLDIASFNAVRPEGVSVIRGQLVLPSDMGNPQGYTLEYNTYAKNLDDLAPLVKIERPVSGMINFNNQTGIGQTYRIDLSEFFFGSAKTTYSLITPVQGASIDGTILTYKPATFTEDTLSLQFAVKAYNGYTESLGYNNGTLFINLTVIGENSGFSYELINTNATNIYVSAEPETKVVSSVSGMVSPGTTVMLMIDIAEGKSIYGGGYKLLTADATTMAVTSSSFAGPFVDGKFYLSFVMPDCDVYLKLTPVPFSQTLDLTGPSRVKVGSKAQYFALETHTRNQHEPSSVIWSVSGNTSEYTTIDKYGLLTIGDNETGNGSGSFRINAKLIDNLDMTYQSLPIYITDEIEYFIDVRSNIKPYYNNGLMANISFWDIEPMQNTSRSGEFVTVTFVNMPDGKRLDSAYMRKIGGSEIILCAVKDNSFSFVMPAYDVIMFYELVEK